MIQTEEVEEAPQFETLKTELNTELKTTELNSIRNNLILSRDRL